MMQTIQAICKQAIDRNQTHLNEADGYKLLSAAGVGVPNFEVVKELKDIQKLSLTKFAGQQVVCKLLSHKILHKSELGGVAVVDKTPEAISSFMEKLFKKVNNEDLDGVLICEKMTIRPTIGNELLLNIRHTPDFGVVVSLGQGGIYTELLNKAFSPNKSMAFWSASNLNKKVIEEALSSLAIKPVLLDGFRGEPAITSIKNLTTLIQNVAKFALEVMPHWLTEIEINPLIFADQQAFALDSVIKLQTATIKAKSPRPIEKINQLLHPKSIALMGVSEKINPGHIILNNLLKCEFPASEIYIIKPNSQPIEGVKCYDNLNSLPKTVDLMILSIAAKDVPNAIMDVIETRKVHSLIIIPGGLEEKSGTTDMLKRMHEAIEMSRETSWKGPIINGGNCLGIRSSVGKYDTLFLPAYKIPALKTKDYSRMALISQSGAFLASKIDKLEAISPKYAISIGNQMDVTIGDYLEYLKNDSEIDLFTVYVEGFKPDDGLKFLNNAREIVKAGKTVLLYQAGRTAAGAKATSSHTASIAGDYMVNTSLCKQAGIVVAESLSEFEELAIMFSFLRNKPVKGNRLAAMSNAGFECVALADNLGSLQMANFSHDTNNKLEEVFASAHIQDIVDVHNPLDLTPMANDQAYEQTISIMLNDKDVDLGVVGIVPMTPALNTLPKGTEHKENYTDSTSIASRLLQLKEQVNKPWVAVVDGGVRYNDFCNYLLSLKIPVYRSMDVALQRLSKYYDVMSK